MNIDYKKYLFLVAVLPVFCYAQSYSKLYPKECLATKQVFEQYRNEFEQAGNSTDLSAEFLFAIVAPEISQFSYLSNKIETYSLKVMYVQGGKSYANFSIGLLQMQPAFIEQLDDSIRANVELKNQFSSYLINKPNTRENRVEIIDRLSDVTWQIKYLTVFCTIINRRFSHSQFANENEQLWFFAAAYNVGFQCSETEIKRIGQKSQFPHFSQQKFPYADVSVWFYNEEINHE